MQLARRIAPLLYLALAALALLASQAKPRHDWDLLGYLAASESFATGDPVRLHGFAYGAVRSALSEDEVRFLTESGRTYRRTMAADPEAFAEQLPFYRIRVGYTAAVRAVRAIGVEPVRAVGLVSGLTVAVGVLLAYLLVRGRASPALVCALPGLALVFGVLELARFATPDGMAFLGVIAAGILFQRGSPALLVLLPALVAVRTDLVLFSGPMLLARWVGAPDRRRAVLASFVACCVLYVLITRHFGHPGWATTFYVSLVERPTHPLTDPPTLTAGLYLKTVAKGLWKALSDKSFVLYVTALGLWLLGWRRSSRDRSPGADAATPLILVSAFYVAAHVLLFPAVWERFFVGPYLLTTAALCTLVPRARE